MLKNNDTSADLILTKNHRIKYHSSHPDNMNSIIIGAVGSGKTRGFVKSNLLQTGCSYVITDVKGDLIKEYGNYFIRNGYKIQCINFKDLSNSMRWNPFTYFKDINDIKNFAEAVVKRSAVHSDDSDFWTLSAKNFLTTMLVFIKELTPMSYHKLEYVLDLFPLFSQEGDEYGEAKSSFDKYYTWGLKQNTVLLRNLDNIFQTAFHGGVKTVNCVLMTLAASCDVFIDDKLPFLMSDNELDFEILGKQKSVLFIIQDDVNPQYDFLTGVLYNQIFKCLFNYADSLPSNKLPVPVRFIADDAGNYKILNLPSIISSARSRNISIELIFQSESQGYALYGKDFENLIANSIYMYIGNNDLTTQNNIAARMGVNLKAIQNNTEKCFVFFPSGKTIIDRNCLYEDFSSYKILKKCNNFDISYFSTREREKEPSNRLALNEFLEAKLIKDDCYENLKMRDSIFDSKYEELFYNKIILKNSFFNNYDVKIHVPLREIVDKNADLGDLEYKIMTMHVDFLCVSKTKASMLAIEIDGSQHNSEKQHNNDIIKNKIFECLKIPLYRISTDALTFLFDSDLSVPEEFQDSLLDWLVKRNNNTIQISEYFQMRANIIMNDETLSEEEKIRHIQEIKKEEIPDKLIREPGVCLVKCEDEICEHDKEDSTIAQTEDGHYYDSTTGEIMEPSVIPEYPAEPVNESDISDISSDNIPMGDISNPMVFTAADMIGDAPMYNTEALSEGIENGEDDYMTFEPDMSFFTPPEISEKSNSSDFDMFDFSMEDEFIILLNNIKNT